MGDVQHTSVIIKNSLAKQVYEALRDRILQGELPPGSPLTIATLADDYAVSTTPIREAVKQLEKDGLVLVKPRSGTVVATVEDGEITELYQIRLMVELFAAQYGMPNVTDRDLERLTKLVESMEALVPADDIEARLRQMEYDRAFHTTIVQLLSNEQLNAYYVILRQRVHLMRLKLVRGLPSHRPSSWPEHRAILESFLARDAEGAVSGLKRHLTSSREWALVYASAARAGRGLELEPVR